MLLIFPSIAHILPLFQSQKASSETWPQAASPAEIQTTNGLLLGSYPEACLAT